MGLLTNRCRNCGSSSGTVLQDASGRIYAPDENGVVQLPDACSDSENVNPLTGEPYLCDPEDGTPIVCTTSGRRGAPEHTTNSMTDRVTSGDDATVEDTGGEFVVEWQAGTWTRANNTCRPMVVRFDLDSVIHQHLGQGASGASGMSWRLAALVNGTQVTSLEHDIQNVDGGEQRVTSSPRLTIQRVLQPGDLLSVTPKIEYTLTGDPVLVEYRAVDVAEVSWTQ